MLDMARSLQKLTPMVFHQVAGQPVLTIADNEESVDSGGVMNFVKENSSIRIGVNLNAAEAGPLRLSARLFRLARRIIKNEAGRIAS